MSVLSLQIIVCPLCHASDQEVVGDRVSNAPESKVYRCKRCEVVFLFPIMSPEEEKAFYQAEWDKYMEGRSGAGWKSPAAHFRSYQPEGERRLSLIRSHLKADDSAIEIGSATGYFLDDLRGYVAKVAGVEPNPLQREFANQRGIQTYTSLQEAGTEKFDLIFMYYVVEHLRHPIRYLSDLRSHLNPGGRLVIEVPNVEDALLGTYKIPSFAPFYWQKAHYFNFSKKTLSDVLQSAGYAIQLIPVQRYDLSNHMVWMMEGKPGGAGRFKNLFSQSLEAAYADTLKAQWRCDTLMAVATVNPAPHRGGSARAGHRTPPLPGRSDLAFLPTPRGGASSGGAG